jgi:hypothetical protein
MSESIQSRTYTPPPAGSFDPLTVGITGDIPAFFTYGPARPRTPTTPVRDGLGAFQPSDGGGGGGGGDREGGANMGGQMAGNLGNLSNIDFSNVSLSGGLRGAGLGGMIGGPFGAVLGGLAGAFGPAISDARQAQAVALANQQALARDLEALGIGGGFTGMSMDEAVANAVAANIDADYGPGGMFGGDYGDSSNAPDSAPGGEASTSGGDMGGGPSGDSGDGYKEGGLVKFAEGGVVSLQGGGKIAIGPGGGLDDLIPTSINGRQAAALSDGEFVIPADVVSMMGDGSSNAGARRLYDLVRQVRDTKTGTTRQAGPLPVGEILKRSLGQ